MGHFRDRRAFGNVGTRRFRGARYGDGKSPRFTGLLDLYSGASAAYSLRALSRGWLAGDVVEVRRSSDSTSQDFTASQITNGAMLDFVNHGTSDLYNSARYFNGTSTCVKTSGMTASSNYFGACTISADITVSSISASPQCIWALGTSAYRLFISATGQWRTNGGVLDLGAVSAGSYSVSVTYDSSGNARSLSVDSVEIWSGNEAAGTAETSFIIGARGLASTGVYFNGIIHNFAIAGSSVKNFAYTGLGTSVTAWQDTIGSNDGTETNGAAYTGQPFNGFVSTWYDQSGNANDATQATTTAQPKIVSAGALVTGGLDFDGVDDALKSVTFTRSDTTKLSIFAVAKADSTTSNNAIVGQYDTSLNDRAFTLQFSNGDVYKSLISSDGTRTGSTAQETGSTENYGTTEHLVSSFYDGSLSLSNQQSIFSDGSALTLSLDATYNASVSAILNNDADLSIGSSLSGGSPVAIMDGTIQEVIIYPSDQSANRAAIEANINAAYQIF